MGILAIIGIVHLAGAPAIGIPGDPLQETTSLISLLETTSGVELTESL